MPVANNSQDRIQQVSRLGLALMFSRLMDALQFAPVSQLHV